MLGWLGSPEVKVGALVVAVSGLIGVMATKVAEGPGVFANQRTYTFHADTAGGLIQNSAVKMAGIKIGLVREIVLEDGRARIVIGVNRDAKIGQSSRVYLKTDGILGDKHVEMTPGQPNESDLPGGAEIQLADTSGGGPDDVMAQVSKVAKNLNDFAETLNKSAKQGDVDSRLGRILGNIEKITGDLKEITGKNKDRVADILSRVQSIANNVDKYIDAQALARVNHSLKNVEEITSKLNKGEGTLGKLINDGETVEQINAAVASVNKFLGGANQLETSVDFHSEFMQDNGNKSFLGVRVQPGLDRYYEVDVISDTTGVTRTVDTQSTIDGVEHRSEETTTYKNKLKITGLFAKNFWDFTFKAGIIQNYGGAGLDYFVGGNRDLRLSVELFNFNEMQLRIFARYNFFKGIYVVGGGDNLFAKADGTSSLFVGAGVFITNEDLKLFATRFTF